jgi:hypothetical protein
VDSRQQTEDSRQKKKRHGDAPHHQSDGHSGSQQTTDSRQQTADSRQQRAKSTVQLAVSRQKTKEEKSIDRHGYAPHHQSDGHSSSRQGTPPCSHVSNLEVFFACILQNHLAFLVRMMMPPTTNKELGPHHMFVMH